MLRKFSNPSDRKKLIFYPQSFKKSDELLTEFRILNSGNPSLSQARLDPEEMGFAQPDFGFESNLNFAQNTSPNGWQRFLDCISKFPKHEMLKNYVNFVNQKKIMRLNDQLFKKAKKNPTQA